MTLKSILVRSVLAAVVVVAASGVALAAIPNLGGVNPNRGPSNGGQIVSISGAGFTGTTKVTFGNVETTDFHVVSDNRIDVATPPHDPGQVDVSVTNGDGTGTQAGAYTYLAVAGAADDSYQTQVNTPLLVPAPGVLANDVAGDSTGSLSASIWTGPSHGSVTLASDGGFTYTPVSGFAGTDSFTYRVVSDVGVGTVGTVTITVAGTPTAQNPTALVVWSINGNVVTLRWIAPTAGLIPTNYAVACGLNPGEAAQVFVTSDTSTVFTFTAPSGVFYCRVHARAGDNQSAASNEVRIAVTAAIPPSAPENLAGTANGSSLVLSWRKTYDGGVPTAVVLDVTGPVVTSLPLGNAENFSFAGVPPGTYTLSVRSVNAAGSSAPSNPVTLSFPATCTGAPPAPSDVAAYKVGNTIFVIWGPSPAGTPAASSYAVNVTGSFVGTLTTASRMVSGTVGAGSYSFSIQAINACGASAPTVAQTVIVP